MGPPARVEPGAGTPARIIATSDELRRAALARSARRSAEVARGRLRRRWLSWCLGQLLLWTLPFVLLAELGWALWWRDHPLPPPLQGWLGSAPPASYPAASRPAASAAGPTSQGAP